MLLTKMIHMKVLVFLTIVALSMGALELPDDLKQMANMLRQNCIEETGADEGVINACGTGNFADDPKLKCYFKCVYGQMGVISDEGEIDADSFGAILPENLAPKLMPMVENCKNTKGADACEVAFEFNKCLYTTNPDNFFSV